MQIINRNFPILVKFLLSTEFLLKFFLKWHLHTFPKHSHLYINGICEITFDWPLGLRTSCSNRILNWLQTLVAALILIQQFMYNSDGNAIFNTTTTCSYCRWLDCAKACYTYKHLSKASLKNLKYFQVIHFLHSKLYLKTE